MQTELLLVVIAKALVELGGMFMLGRGLLYLLAGAKRDANLFYQVLCIVTNPMMHATRWITPKIVVDRHVPVVAFLLLAWAWLGIVFWILPDLCASGVDCAPLIERKRSA